MFIHLLQMHRILKNWRSHDKHHIEHGHGVFIAFRATSLTISVIFHVGLVCIILVFRGLSAVRNVIIRCRVRIVALLAIFRLSTVLLLSQPIALRLLAILPPTLLPPMTIIAHKNRPSHKRKIINPNFKPPLVPRTSRA